MTEYSLAALLDHPGLGLVMIGEGIDRRCLELMLDARNRDQRYAGTVADKRLGMRPNERLSVVQG